jgi:hypothetical protein
MPFPFLLLGVAPKPTLSSLSSLIKIGAFLL